jgi:hypothetical protein
MASEAYPDPPALLSACPSRAYTCVSRVTKWSVLTRARRSGQPRLRSWSLRTRMLGAFDHGALRGMFLIAHAVCLFPAKELSSFSSLISCEVGEHGNGAFISCPLVVNYDPDCTGLSGTACVSSASQAVYPPGIDDMR